MGKQILICSTIIVTIEGFLIPHIKLLKNMGYEVDVAANCDYYLENSELENLIRNRYDLPFQRTPFSNKNFKAARELKQISIKNKYDIVHFHTPVASVFGRYYLKPLRKDGLKLYYTAHGFHFYKGAPAKNWIMYYPMEKWLSKYTDVLITINEEDYKIADDKFKAKMNYKIPGVGIDIKKFSDVEVNVKGKRRELGIPEDAFLLISVGELNKNKNHKIIIEAMSKFNDKNLYYLICGEGAERNNLVELAKSLNLMDRIIMPGRRSDIPELLKISDLFVFPSKREGLPVSIMEAAASGLPAIASNIRGCKDLIIDGISGVLIDNNINLWLCSISESHKNYSKIQSFAEYSKNEIKKFETDEVLQHLRKIYYS